MHNRKGEKQKSLTELLAEKEAERRVQPFLFKNKRNFYISIFALIYLALTINQKMSLHFLRGRNQAVSLTNKHCVVVGGTNGIGLGVAMRLAQADADVTIVGRNEERGNQIVKEMSGKGKGKHSFVKCDSSLIKNVKACCEELKQQHPVIDYLVLSQGIATIQGRTPTAEGIDEKLSLHYFSRIAFIVSLLPSLRQSAATTTTTATTNNATTVLSVLSAGIHGRYSHYSDDFEMVDNYSLKNAADAAGFYTDAAMESLAKEENRNNNDNNKKKIVFAHAAPGFVSTAWGTEMPFYLKPLIRFGQLFAKSADDCAEYMFDILIKQQPATGNSAAKFYDQYAGEVNRLPNEEECETIWTKTRAILSKLL